MLDSFFNTIFGPFINWNPLIAMLIISLLMTLLITLSYKYLTNQELMKSLKNELKDFQKQMKDNKDNAQKVMEIQKQSLEKNMKYMMHSFKPTLYTFIPLIIIFTWLRNTYSGKGALIFGLTWIWVYIISSIIFSILLRKLLKVS